MLHLWSVHCNGGIDENCRGLAPCMKYVLVVGMAGGGSEGTAEGNGAPCVTNFGQRQQKHASKGPKRAAAMWANRLARGARKSVTPNV